VEQPFPYDLERHRMDVRSVSARKPLFLDESAHDWRLVRLGRDLGWSGVALKTCKTQTGALLSACWAKAHGMSLMVQDLTNPMLAQIPHVLLAAHAEGLGTCWMTGANYLEKEILKVLGKEDKQLLAITPIGYSAKEPPAPPRKGREVRWLGF